MKSELAAAQEALRQERDGYAEARRLYTDEHVAREQAEARARELDAALTELVSVLRERHYGAMPAEVQAAYDKAAALTIYSAALAPAGGKTDG